MVLANHRLERGGLLVIALATCCICACFEDPESAAETAAASSSGDAAAGESTSTAPADGTDEGEGSEDGNDTTDGSPTCGNGQVEGDELCDDGNENDTDDCTTAYAPPACDDGLLSGDESDVDCGGRCEPCGTTQGCVADSDCTSGNCYAGACVPECVEWRTQFGSAGNDGASDIAIDAAGTVYVSGGTSGSLGGGRLQGPRDAFLVTLDPQGAVLSTRLIGTPEGDAANESVVGAGGALYLAGSTGGVLGTSSAGMGDAWVGRFCL